MKKIIVGIMVIFILFTLTACDQVTITPGIVDVQFENPRYENGSVIIDVWITNGTTDNVELGYVDFWLEFPESVDISALGVTEFCGAGFPIDEVIKSNKYKRYELEFTSEYIFVTETEMEQLGVTLDDLDLYFNINE